MKPNNKNSALEQLIYITDAQILLGTLPIDFGVSQLKAFRNMTEEDCIFILSELSKTYSLQYGPNWQHLLINQLETKLHTSFITQNSFIPSSFNTNNTNL